MNNDVIYRTIKNNFFADPYIQELNATEKLIYIYLFTCQFVDALGIMEATVRQMSFDLSITSKKINTTLTKLENDRKIIRFNNCVWVVNFMKHQTRFLQNNCKTKIINDNQAKHLVTIFALTNDETIKRKIIAHYPIISDLITALAPNDNSHIPLQAPSEGVPNIPKAPDKELQNLLEEHHITQHYKNNLLTTTTATATANNATNATDTAATTTDAACSNIKLADDTQNLLLQIKKQAQAVVARFKVNFDVKTIEKYPLSEFRRTITDIELSELFNEIFGPITCYDSWDCS